MEVGAGAAAEDGALVTRELTEKLLGGGAVAVVAGTADPPFSEILYFCSYLDVVFKLLRSEAQAFFLDISKKTQA